MKKIILRFLAVAFISCFVVFAGSTQAFAEHKDITVEEAIKLMEENKNNSNFVIIDVRTPEEFAEGHLPGAINMNIGSADFATQVGKLDSSKTYLVHCQAGVRGRRALETFKKANIMNVFHMKEGYAGYVEFINK